MKAVVLAAGEGTRMWPLAENRPKHLLPVGDRTIITNILHSLAENGISEILVVVGFKGDLIRSEIADIRDKGVNVRFGNQKHWNGTASALNVAYEAMGKEPFLAIYGDLWLNASAIKSVIEKSHSYSRVMGIVPVENPAEFGVVELEGGQLVRIAEKPRVRVGARGFVNSGIYYLDGEVFDAIRRTSRSKRGEYELTTSLQKLLDDGKEIGGATIDKQDWLDVGRPWDILEANGRALMSMTGDVKGEVESGAVIRGPVTIQEGAVLKSGSYLEGPVFVGRNCSVGPNAYIRASTCLERDVHIGSSCEIKNSVIMKGTKVPHISYVGDSIIGENCNLGAGTITANLRFDDQTIRTRVKNRLEDSRRRKLGAILGDRVQTGINVTLFPGIKVGSDSWIGPGAVVEADVSTGSLLTANSKILKRIRRR